MGIGSDVFAGQVSAQKPFYRISLAQFSFAPSFFTRKMDTLDFPAKAKKTFGIDAVEYVSMFFKDKVSDRKYMEELRMRSGDMGVRNVLIMVDAEGDLGHSATHKRNEAVDNHTKWLEFAKYLGCHSIRVNIDGDGSDEEIFEACLEGYGKLVGIGAKMDMGVIIENHNGPTNDPAYLAKIMKNINHPNAGTLPDFGNFIRRTKPEAMTMEAYGKTKVVAEYDKYKGVEMLMPYAKGVSAKTHTFDAAGNCRETDFKRIMSIVEKNRTDAFRGFVGIEYEGAVMSMMGSKETFLPEEEGIWATKKLLS
jgi:sugar phosphate isomerase/epimerase